LKRAIAHPPLTPVTPDSLLAGYGGTPLVKKLGIKPNTIVTLIGAPDYFDRLLVPLPTAVTIRRRLGKNNDLIIWFVKSRKTLRDRVQSISRRVGKAGIWIAWPKQSSQIFSDLSQKSVRDAGLNAGFVDYKVCAIDSTWAGLKFSARKDKQQSI